MSPRIAIIGLGVMAGRMITNIHNHGGPTVAAGWDPNPEARDRAAALAPEMRIGDNAAEIIADADVDAVYIASPPAFHREYAEAAARAGKPVLCEKPLGVDVAESRALVDLVTAEGIGNAVNFSLTSAPAAAGIEAALADGTIGNVAAVDVRMHYCKWPRDWQEPAAWLCEREQGGFVRETFSHYAYLSDRLFGPARLVSAATRYPDDGRSAETQALALMDCGGIPVSFAGGTGGIDASDRDRIEYTVWGSKAIYRLYDWNRLRSSDGGPWTEHLSDIPDTRQEGYRRQLQNIHAFMSGEPHTMPDFAQALRVQELVEQILAA